MSDETKNNPLVETEESSDPMLEAASDLTCFDFGVYCYRNPTKPTQNG